MLLERMLVLCPFCHAKWWLDQYLCGTSYAIDKDMGDIIDCDKHDNPIYSPYIRSKECRKRGIYNP
jgi:hypothetical protein